MSGVKAGNFCYAGKRSPVVRQARGNLYHYLATEPGLLPESDQRQAAGDMAPGDPFTAFCRLAFSFQQRIGGKGEQGILTIDFRIHLNTVNDDIAEILAESFRRVAEFFFQLAGVAQRRISAGQPPKAILIRRVPCLIVPARSPR